MAWTQVANIKGPTGSQGPTGPQGPQGIPGGTTNWRGSWASTNSYAVNDAVTYNGSSYVCTTAIAAGGSSPDTDPTHWQLAAAAGATGPQGPAGAPGSTGATGATGTRGSLWYQGSGAPGTITGSLPNDMYLDTSTGNVWQLS